ncbi:OmpA family protein [Tepidimonas sp.]|uniref:OmpA family protein n=1 Tax=Tepidimonas sp. TaxID=2002775 RepID=UPI00405523A4
MDASPTRWLFRAPREGRIVRRNAVSVVDGAARKNKSPWRKVGVGRTPRHEHLQPRSAIPHEHDGGRWARRGVWRAQAQMRSDHDVYRMSPSVTRDGSAAADRPEVEHNGSDLAPSGASRRSPAMPPLTLVRSRRGLLVAVVVAVALCGCATMSEEQKSGTVRGATNRADIKPNFRAVLDTFAAGLNRNPGARVTIVGHTDSTGSDAINDSLSVSCAAAVRNDLTTRGVAAGRIVIDGRGAREPVASNDTAEGRARNRRVEIFVAEQTN